MSVDSSKASQPGPLPGEKARRQGLVFLKLFVELAELAPTEAVLEPGCGTGRMAQPLTRYLTTGSYDGFDVMREAIEVCQREIDHPRFRFRHVDVFNRFYNPEGKLDPESFGFPYLDASFDFVFLTSVFTHMLPPEVERYLAEIRRVLRPAGRCLATFFVLNKESIASARAGGSRKRFPHEGNGYRYSAPDNPEKCVGYRERDVLGLIERAGLELDGLHFGRWSGRPDARAPGQDVVIVRRVD